MLHANYNYVLCISISDEKFICLSKISNLGDNFYPIGMNDVNVATKPHAKYIISWRCIQPHAH
jgi:hypothetical protein